MIGRTRKARHVHSRAQGLEAAVDAAGYERLVGRRQALLAARNGNSGMKTDPEFRLKPTHRGLYFALPLRG